MERKYSVCKCPRCNSYDLSAVYEENPQKKKSIIAVILFGIWGALYALIKAGLNRMDPVQNAYWVCNDCGFTFPISNEIENK